MTQTRVPRQVRITTYYKKTFGTPEGQKVLSDLMKVTNMIGTSFDVDPYVTAFNEGARSVTTRILHILKTDPEQLRKMLEQDNQGEDNA